jgi:hypothetical protein
MTATPDLSLTFVPMPNRCVIFVPSSDPSIYFAHVNAQYVGMRHYLRRPGAREAAKVAREYEEGRARLAREVGLAD